VAKVLLGVTGSVAAVKTPDLFLALQQAGHQVKVVATAASLYFFDPAALAPNEPGKRVRNRDQVILDEDEWPGRERGQRYMRDEPVLHIELRRWAELFLLAPLDANTLAKLAQGLCDNCLTCVWRAWDRSRPVILAPAMNTLMWEHPFTERHLRQAAMDFSCPEPPSRLGREELIGWINENCRQLRVVPPQSKELACGDVGLGALADVKRIVAAVSQCLERIQ